MLYIYHELLPRIPLTAMASDAKELYISGKKRSSLSEMPTFCLVSAYF